MRRSLETPVIRILLVDDNRYFLESLAFILDLEQDMEVVGTCEEGRGCLEVVERTAPDVIILDLVLPDIDGLSLLEKIKGKYPDIPVIILSVYGEYHAQAFERGAYSYLVKGGNLEDLYETIRRAWQETAGGRDSD